MKTTTLITGAGRGIGLEIANIFASKRQDLVLVVRKKKQIKKLLELKKKYKINIKIFVGDLRNENFIRKLDKLVPKVDNLINNAGGENIKDFIKINKRDLDDMIAVNLKAVFLISQIFSKKMIKKKIKGCIVSLSSQLGHIGAYNRSIYCMTKFGLEGLTKAMAMDLGKFGIRVNTVSPTKTIIDENELLRKKKRLNIIKKKIPLKKFSTTKQIASIVYFLTTESAASITGTSIISDGGWTAGK